MKVQNSDLLKQVQAVQAAHGWDFTRAWNHVLAESPSLRQSSTVRVDSRQADREKDKLNAKIEAEARILMSQQRHLTFGQALAAVRERTQHSLTFVPAARPTTAAATVKVEPIKEPKLTLVRGIEVDMLTQIELGMRP